MLTDEPAEYKLKMEIGTLTTLLLGYKTAERLYALERIEGKQEAVDRLDDVLFHKIPYISDVKREQIKIDAISFVRTDFIILCLPNSFFLLFL